MNEIVVLFRDNRIRYLIWLLCSTGTAGLGFWYPVYVLARHGAPDDRGGVVFMAGTPFYLIGAVIAITAFIALLASVRRERMPRLHFVQSLGRY